MIVTLSCFIIVAQIYSLVKERKQERGDLQQRSPGRTWTVAVIAVWVLDPQVFKPRLSSFLDVLHSEAPSLLPDSTDHIRSFAHLPQSDLWPPGSSCGTVRIKSPAQGRHSRVDEGEARGCFSQVPEESNLWPCGQKRTSIGSNVWTTAAVLIWIWYNHVISQLELGRHQQSCNDLGNQWI